MPLFRGPAIPFRYKQIGIFGVTELRSCVTAIGNDYGFDQVFARQIEAQAHPGDVAIGISTSGNSSNVLSAFWTARKMGLHAVALTGSTGGKFKDNSRVLE